MKLFLFVSLLLTASLSANAASSLQVLDEPAYAQTRYAISRENCQVMWILPSAQTTGFSVREMRSCPPQQDGLELQVQLRTELLTAIQQDHAAPQALSGTESGLANQSKLAARRLADMRSLAMGSLEQMPHWRQALQQALAADATWRAARGKLGKGQSNLALEKILVAIANREAVFSDLNRSFAHAGYALQLRNIEKLRYTPDGSLLDCQLFFSVTPLASNSLPNASDPASGKETQGR